MEIGSVLTLAINADRCDRLLLGSSDAPSALRELLALARASGTCAVHPASNSGERLVGALLLTAAGELHLWECTSGEPVLVIDGVVASTAGLQRAMDLVRSEGATEVRGAAIAYGPAVQGPDTVATSDVTLIGLSLREFSAA